MGNIDKHIVIARRHDKAISLDQSDCFSSHQPGLAMTTASPSLRGTKQSFLTLVLLVLSFSANAKILLPQILSSNMVLQRDKPINIWGFASPDEKVEVTFAGQRTQAITDKNGNWSVLLSPLKTSAQPQTMTISGTNKIELTNILVGEVWLCSGQSNMEYQMRKLAKIPKPKNEKLRFPADAVEKAKNQQIRIFLVNRKQLTKPDSIHKSWAVAEDSALRAFSAVGYFFAKEIQEKLGIPVGMISSAVSGSAIEPWVSPEAFAQEEYFKNKKVSNDPGKFYTPMIEPLTKFKVRGFLWYQGETNCFLNETISYSYKLKTLVNLWRKAWGEQLPFYYVQIAPYDYSTQKSDRVVLTPDTEPNFWEAQQQVLLLPNTGIIATSDLNDNGADLHPTYKWEVGRRLALLALGKTYNQKIEFSGPVYKSVGFKNNMAIMDFDYLRPIAGNIITGFTIAGSDGKFVVAKANIREGKVIVSSNEVPNPKAVRYNWTENPTGNLYSNGLPALPFRTDNPLTSQFKTN
ncbi:sialate O-acetylesterase [Pedobacter sp. MC2016-05]|uniref:sialate O-acetylesterase n=1 Tax=Pedobacter sp. MC2016-05 TaxID=2994474 RepID=UPI00224853F9|nr:sialate O-acetylesterase [Pedobacter sp. MC2016-05]MCX2476647.1 sialate O-acetylesterase [Pedobacter sp. MC2016-05]